MSRATQWQPLSESDPVPGDTYEIERAGKHYSEMATEIEDQVGRLREIVSGTLQGGYVQALRTAADGLKDELGQTSGRYHEVGGTLDAWAWMLGGFQDEAERLRVQAVAAQGEMNANRLIPPFAPADGARPSDAVVAAAKATQARYDEAGGDLSRAQARLVDLTERRDTAAGKVADEIRQECDDSVRDRPWDNFMDWMDQHHELVSTACKILGGIAMAACVVALFVPGLNIVAAGVLAGVAIGASSLSLVGHSALAVSGNGSWVDVGIDVIALATFGAGRFLWPGVKVLGKQFGGALGRLTAETKAAGGIARGNAARGPIQAKVNTEIAQARLRLVGGSSKSVARSVRLEVKAIRSQGVIDGDQAFKAARDTYAAQNASVTLGERLRYGGGDPDLATLHMESQKAALGFASTSQVGLAAAKANAQYMKAAVPMGASTAAGMWGVRTDLFPIAEYDAWRDQWPTKVKGDL